MRWAAAILSLTCAAAVGCRLWTADGHGRGADAAVASSPAADGGLRVKTSPASAIVRHGVLGCQFEIVIEDMEPDAANAIVARGLPILDQVENLPTQALAHYKKYLELGGPDPDNYVKGRVEQIESY